jgi:hypothetical protein
MQQEPYPGSVTLPAWLLIRLIRTAWAAGLFEGEGCFYVRSRRRVGAQLAMTDRDVVERFAAIVGLGTLHRKEPRRSHWQHQYVWQTQSAQPVRDLIARFWPYLGERRRARARAVLAHARDNKGLEAARTHCPAGHPYDVANTCLTRSGKRECRTCRNARKRRYYRRRRRAPSPL